MSTQIVTIHLPNVLYEQARRRAEETHRSIEAELVEVLASALPTGQRYLATMNR
jgi:plasmid stability protein